VVKCHGCSRDLVVPASHVRVAVRECRPYVTFCTRACNLKYVAMEGARQQEEQIKNADRHID
jgi:hypothetical protein